MLQVRHHNLETGHTEDIGQPVPNRSKNQAEQYAQSLNNGGVADRDLYYVGTTNHRTKHDFPRENAPSTRAQQ